MGLRSSWSAGLPSVGTFLLDGVQELALSGDLQLLMEQATHLQGEVEYRVAVATRCLSTNVIGSSSMISSQLKCGYIPAFMNAAFVSVLLEQHPQL